jgi:hypothetical protein|eukprot:SAG25_NODE_307_length_10059_cov_4.956124_12_plen_169_part_00
MRGATSRCSVPSQEQQLRLSTVLKQQGMPAPARWISGAYQTVFEDERWLQEGVRIGLGPQAGADTFVDYWSRLLRLEEDQMMRDITQYNLYNIDLQPAGTRSDLQDCVQLTVKGVSENRPSLSYGDHVRIRLRAAPSKQLPPIPQTVCATRPASQRPQPAWPARRQID